MRKTIGALCLAVTVAGSTLAQVPAAPTAGQAATDAGQSAPTTGDRWPKSAEYAGATYTVYQPQLDAS